LLDNFVDVPESLRAQVSQRLKITGLLKKITHNVKVGLTAAIGEIKGFRADAKVPDVKSVLDHDGPRPVDTKEKLALQDIYTLETLIQESTIDDHNSGVDLYKLFYIKDAPLAIEDEEE
jgi:hypothetical protein